MRFGDVNSGSSRVNGATADIDLGDDGAESIQSSANTKTTFRNAAVLSGQPLVNAQRPFFFNLGFPRTILNRDRDLAYVRAGFSQLRSLTKEVLRHIGFKPVTPGDSGNATDRISVLKEPRSEVESQRMALILLHLRHFIQLVMCDPNLLTTSDESNMFAMNVEMFVSNWRRLDPHVFTRLDKMASSSSSARGKEHTSNPLWPAMQQDRSGATDSMGPGGGDESHSSFVGEPRISGGVVQWCRNLQDAADTMTRVTDTVSIQRSRGRQVKEVSFTSPYVISFMAMAAVLLAIATPIVFLGVTRGSDETLFHPSEEQANTIKWLMLGLFVFLLASVATLVYAYIGVAEHVRAVDSELAVFSVESALAMNKAALLVAFAEQPSIPEGSNGGGVQGKPEGSDGSTISVLIGRQTSLPLPLASPASGTSNITATGVRVRANESAMSRSGVVSFAPSQQVSKEVEFKYFDENLRNERRLSVRNKSFDRDLFICGIAKGVIFFWNRGAELLTGFKAADVHGKLIDTVMDPPSAATTKEMFEDARARYNRNKQKKRPSNASAAAAAAAAAAANSGEAETAISKKVAIHTASGDPQELQCVVMPSKVLKGNSTGKQTMVTEGVLVGVPTVEASFSTLMYVHTFASTLLQHLAKRHATGDTAAAASSTSPATSSDSQRVDLLSSVLRSSFTWETITSVASGMHRWRKVGADQLLGVARRQAAHRHVSIEVTIDDAVPSSLFCDVKAIQTTLADLIDKAQIPVKISVSQCCGFQPGRCTVLSVRADEAAAKGRDFLWSTYLSTETAKNTKREALRGGIVMATSPESDYVIELFCMTMRERLSETLFMGDEEGSNSSRSGIEASVQQYAHYPFRFVLLEPSLINGQHVKNFLESAKHHVNHIDATSHIGNFTSDLDDLPDAVVCSADNAEFTQEMEDKLRKIGLTIIRYKYSEKVKMENGPNNSTSNGHVPPRSSTQGFSFAKQDDLENRFSGKAATVKFPLVIEDFLPIFESLKKKREERKVTEKGFKITDFIVKQEQIGHGASGVVHKIEDTSTGGIMAMKIIPINQTEMLDRGHSTLLKEVLAMRKFRSDNLVKLFDCAIIENKEYRIFMEYCQLSLDKLLDKRSNHRLSVQEAATVAHAVCTCLTYLHREECIHGDIKPHNIMLSTSAPPVVKVGDLGSTQLLSKKAVGDVVAKEAMLAGTLLYLCPEKFLGGERSKPSDIWSLGISLMHLLGALPGELTGCKSEQDFVELYSKRQNMQNRSRRRMKDMLREPLFDVELPRALYIEDEPPGGAPPSVVAASSAASALPSPTPQERQQDLFLHRQRATKEEVSDAVDFIKKCIVLDPSMRASAATLLDHPFLIHRSVDCFSAPAGGVPQGPGAAGPQGAVPFARKRSSSPNTLLAELAAAAENSNQQYGTSGPVNGIGAGGGYHHQNTNGAELHDDFSVGSSEDEGGVLMGDFYDETPDDAEIYPHYATSFQ